MFSLSSKGVQSFALKVSRITSPRYYFLQLSCRKSSNLFNDFPPEEPQITVRSKVRNVPVDLERVKKECELLRKILKIESLGLDISFVSMIKIREVNSDWREIPASTDVLSFPLFEFIEPEKFKMKKKDFAGALLGEILFCPAYIKKRMEEDEQYFKQNGRYNDEFDAGVSAEMARTFNVQDRITLLLIHSILHLLGYDHETDKDYRIMTKRETEVIMKFRKLWKKESEAETSTSSPPSSPTN